MNFLQRMLLKQRDSIAYKHWKFLDKLSRVELPDVALAPRPEWHFKHSGNAGDIIYSMPAMLAIAGDAPVHIHLAVDQPAKMPKSFRHPLGNVLLNRKMLEMLRPLLLSNPQVASVQEWDGRSVDVDLDQFRNIPLMYDRGNIARWYMLIWGVNWDLNNPWLYADAEPSVSNAIVLARSSRYQAPGIDYSFLRVYPEVVFVGVQQEYDDMKKMVPNAVYRPSKDFLDLARVIRGSRLFIGNQSFPFSVAEALKTRRLLENYFRTPNVIVYGADGYDFSFQKPFEKLVRQLYAKAD
ncbi:MAG: hypothetical protein EOP50_05950 [Sphingobacteriales bacterium]|nr:MAG: hypothetical protein EOP50_05950 [Sphingobacteriales bacterium]